jgi:hypothetical protein
MTEDPPSYPPLVPIYPAAEIDALYVALQVELERLQADLVEAEAAALEAEARLRSEPFDPEVIRRVTAHTDRVVAGLAAEAQREAEQLVLDARRVAAQRVGEAAAEAERQIADARVQLERALAMARTRTPGAVARPAEPSPAPLSSPAPDPESLSAATSAAKVVEGHDEFWHESRSKSWTRRVPAGMLAQLIGAVLVLALILVRLA